MQRVIKGLKDDMIEKKTIGILKEMDKEFYQNLKKLQANLSFSFKKHKLFLIKKDQYFN